MRIAACRPAQLGDHGDGAVPRQLGGIGLGDGDRLLGIGDDVGQPLLDIHPFRRSCAPLSVMARMARGSGLAGTGSPTVNRSLKTASRPRAKIRCGLPLNCNGSAAAKGGAAPMDRLCALGLSAEAFPAASASLQLLLQRGELGGLVTLRLLLRGQQLFHQHPLIDLRQRIGNELVVGLLGLTGWPR
jgi:hypothetical protein